MSVDFANEDSVDLTISLGDLRITISGPSQQASELVAFIVRHHPQSARSSSPGQSSHYSVVDPPPSVSEAARPPVQRRTLETRSQIEASFNHCPGYLEAAGNRLSGGSLSGVERIRRAWRAGQWAGAVLGGRVGSPNRTPQIDLRPRYYVVLRNSEGPAPACFSSSQSYWRSIGRLRDSDTISHSFPSESEARAYCAGADIPFPEVQQ